jgi:hypothetical protein
MEVLARPKKALSSTHRDTVVPVSGPLPPEVLFHRYFPRLSSPQDRERYRGKLDLDTLPDPDMSKVLKELQDDFNMSFAESREALASLGRPLPVHLDYVDSHVANAIAFESDGYYFIGLTLPLLEIIRLNSAALMLSDQVWAFLDLPYVSDRIPDRMEPCSLSKRCLYRLTNSRITCLDTRPKISPLCAMSSRRTPTAAWSNKPKRPWRILSRSSPRLPS